MGRVWPGRRVTLTAKVVTGTTGVVRLLSEERAVLTLVSLHNVQVFRLLLKTSVERSTHELNLFLAGFALLQSLVCL